jgi:signal transduction histidine kinase/ActR/RegA family two-component response regulator
VSKLKDIVASSGKQVLLVILAFLVMTVASSFYVSSVMKKQIDLHGRSELLLYEAYLRTLIMANEDALKSATSVILWALKRGAGDAEILEEIRSLTSAFKKQEDIGGIFRSIYGFVDGKYIDVNGVVPAELRRSGDGVGTAFEEEEGILHTVSYIDPATKQAVAALSINVVDQSGVKRGRMVIDFYLQPIVDEVKNFKVGDVGFGLLLDSSFMVLSFPERSFVGGKIDEIPGFAGISDQLGGLGDEVLAQRYKLNDVDHVGFFSRLENGWYVGVLAPLDFYYERVSSLFPVILLISLVLAAILSVVLVRLSLAKSRSEEESRLKTSFLARMSHEIRTPMNAIIGLSELAVRDYGGKEALNYISEIHNAGRNLLGIINDILDFSKVESGKLEIHPAPYKPARLLSDVLSMANARLKDKPLVLETDIARDIPSELYGDEGCIRQVLINLISNAIKYTPEGYIKFIVKTQALDDGLIRLSFAVEDSGIGIKKENLGKIFDEFFRPKERVRNAYVEGTGLGLPIAQSYCRLMGGEVTVESVYGTGSTFTATILQKVLDPRLMDLEAYQASRSIRKEVDIPFVSPGFEVLLVDDIETNLMVAVGLLAPYKFETTSCKSGEEALKAAKTRRFDLMFIDHMMPKMDGVETLKRLREAQGGQRGVPAVAFTANAMKGTRELLLASGFDDFISKPVNTEELTALLDKWVPKNRRQAPLPALGREGELRSAEARDPGFIAISGVDTKLGLHRSGGAPRKYLALLKVFLLDSAAALNSLKELDSRTPAADELSGLFHGMKSAAANIGAKDFSEKSKAYEIAAAGGDFSFFKPEVLRTYADDLRLLRENIKKALDEVSLSAEGKEDLKERPGGDPAGEGGREDFFEREKQAVMELHGALERRDVGLADKLIEELEAKASRESRKLYQEMSDLILISDFKGALNIINTMDKEA